MPNKEIIRDSDGDFTILNLVTGDKSFASKDDLAEHAKDGDLDDLFKINLSTLVWENLKAKGDLPIKRSFHQMTHTPGKLHLFGGCSGNDRLAELHTLDLETLEWSLQPKNEGMKGVGGAGFVS